MDLDHFQHFSNRFAGRFLCFVGGFVDATGYVILNGVFTASVTGNIVKFSKSAAHYEFAETFVIVTLSYGFGSAIVRVIVVFLKPLVDIDLIGILVLTLEIFFLLVTIVLGTYLENAIDSSENVEDFCVLLTGVIMAIPMGIQVSTNECFYTKK